MPLLLAMYRSYGYQRAAIPAAVSGRLLTCVCASGLKLPFAWSAKALTVPFAPLRTYRKRPSLLKAMSDGFKVLPSGARMEAAAD